MSGLPALAARPRRTAVVLGIATLLALAAAGIVWPRPEPAGARGVLRTFLNPTPDEFDNFGFSVAAVGSNVLVGAHHEDFGATDSGAAYLFDGATGTLLKTFHQPHPNRYDYFGHAVAAVDGNVLVGAHHAHIEAREVGAAYLFDGATGALLHTFLDPTPTVSGQFGTSVAAVGNNALVGARWDDAAGRGTGAAYLFDGATGALLQTFLDPTPAYQDDFGRSVAALGSNVLVGAPGDDNGARDAGAAYLFDGASGALLHTFSSPIPDAGDSFGWSVAAVGSNVLVGAPAAGEAYLFDGATGALLQTFLPPIPTAGGRFGGSVAAVGGNVLVGALYDSIAARNAGAAYLFDGATGALLQTFTNPGAATHDEFGRSVAAVGSNVLVGAREADIGARDAGAAYLFETGTAAKPTRTHTPTRTDTPTRTATPTPTPCPPEGCPTATATLTPTPTPIPVDFSMGVDTDEDTTDDCATTEGGPTECSVSVGSTFAVRVHLNRLPEGIAGYGGFDISLTYTGVTSEDNATAAPWPDCVFQGNSFHPGVVLLGCAVGIGAEPSTYTGVIGTNDFSCTGEESFANTVTLLHGAAAGDTSLSDEGGEPYDEGLGTTETLIINCLVPTPTPTATATPTPSPTPTPTPEATAVGASGLSGEAAGSASAPDSAPASGAGPARDSAPASGAGPAPDSAPAAGELTAPDSAPAPGELPATGGPPGAPGSSDGLGNIVAGIAAAMAGAVALGGAAWYARRRSAR